MNSGLFFALLPFFMGAAFTLVDIGSDSALAYEYWSNSFTLSDYEVCKGMERQRKGYKENTKQKMVESYRNHWHDFFYLNEQDLKWSWRAGESMKVSEWAREHLNVSDWQTWPTNLTMEWGKFWRTLSPNMENGME